MLPSIHWQRDQRCARRSLKVQLSRLQQVGLGPGADITNASQVWRSGVGAYSIAFQILPPCSTIATAAVW